jgi:anti-anti-sigma factor
MSRPKLTMDVSVDGANATIALHGEIDIATARDVEERAGLVLQRHPIDHLTLDMRDVSMVDSIGVAALVRVGRQVHAAERTMALVKVQPVVRRVLAVTGLTEALNVEAPDAPG